MRLDRILASLLVAAAASCGGDRPADTPSGSSGPVAPGFPRRIELPDGEALAMPDAPRRVLVANTALVDATIALLPRERIAALCDQARTWSSVAQDPAAWEDCPTFRSFEAETVLKHDADLVLCSPFSQPETVDSLQALGIRVLRLPDPVSLDELGPRIELLGRLFGTEDAADRLSARVQERITDLRRRAEARDGRPTVVAYSRLGQDGWTMGAGTLMDEAFALAGLRNAVSAAGREGAVRLTLEELLSLDPDWIVVPDAFGEEDGLTLRFVKDDPSLADLRARRDDRVVALHPWLFSTTSHEILTAAETLSDLLD